MAALRYWQRKALTSDERTPEFEIANDGGTIGVLQPYEIDTLCDRLNSTDDDALKKLSFSALTARVLCLGYAWNNDLPAEIIHDSDEAKILQAFWKVANQVHLFVGHNILDFDLRFLWQRSIILGVKPTRDISFVRFRNNPVYDTMQEWCKWNFKDHVSLDALSRALGITSPKAEGLDGSQVWPYYQAGRVDEIYEYCKRDVEAVRQIYLRLTK